MIRVLIADDHPVVRAGYQRLLEQAGGLRVVGEAADGDAAYEAWLALQPDVLVADVSMPGGGGLELLRRVHRRCQEARSLVFSMHDSEPMVRQAFEAGARGYLVKSSAPENLIEAVRCVDAGGRYLAPELPRRWIGHDPLDEQARIASLSGREFEIFRLLAQGLSVAECGEQLHLSAKTIANHQTVIREKLDVATSAAMAHLALRHGLVETR